MTTFSDAKTAQQYARRVYNDLSSRVQNAPQGETVSLMIAFGFVVEARMDSKWTIRYATRIKGQPVLRGISPLMIALEREWASWEADQIAIAHAHAQAQNKADAQNLAAFEGVTDETITLLTNRPETLRVVAGIARLFHTSQISKLGAIEAMQAAGVALQDAQAESDAWTDATLTRLYEGGPISFAQACAAATPVEVTATYEVQAAVPAFPVESEFAVTLTNGLEPIGTVRVMAQDALQASSKAEKAWGAGAMAVSSVLVESVEQKAVNEAKAIAQATFGEAPAPTAFDWVKECVYIESVTAKKGRVTEMNNNLATFIRYCEMQRNTAERAGFYDSAEYIQHCIDDLTN